MKEKQIEDFSRDICKACVPFTQCELDEPCRMATREAEIYYDLGYRKASEVAREIFEKLKVDLKGYIGLNYLDELKNKYTEEGK